MDALKKNCVGHSEINWRFLGKIIKTADSELR